MQRFTRERLPAAGVGHSGRVTASRLRHAATAPPPPSRQRSGNDGGQDPGGDRPSQDPVSHEGTGVPGEVYGPDHVDRRGHEKEDSQSGCDTHHRSEEDGPPPRRSGRFGVGHTRRLEPYDPEVLPRALIASLLIVTVAAGCGGDDPSVGDQRADQARQAGLDAGLPEDVADFLALAARGVDATYQVTYPSTEATDDLVIASQPPRLRVDVVRGDQVIRTELATDDGSYRCERADAESPLACESTSVVPKAPHALDQATIDALVEALRSGAEDFTFDVTTSTILDVNATCLTTEVRTDRARPELAPAATMCVSDVGVLLRLDRAGEVVEASQYTATVADNTFVRPDDPRG